MPDSPELDREAFSGSSRSDAHPLRRAMRDLVALTAMPSIWSTYDAAQIGESLADVVCWTLGLDLVYVHMPGGSGPRDFVRCPHLHASDADGLAAKLAPCLSDPLRSTMTIPNPFGEGTLSLMIARFGSSTSAGALVAGALQPGFPSETESLLLGVAANQAALALRQRRSQDELAQLLKRGQLLTAIVDSAEYAFMSQNSDGAVTSWNRAAEQWFGYSAEEAIGARVTRLLRPAPGTEEAAILERIRCEEPREPYTVTLLSKEGRPLDLLLDVSPIRDAAGRRVGASIIAREISEEKRSAEASARLAAIVESSDDAIVSKTLEGRIVSWNAGAERLFGYPADEAVGRPITMLIPENRRDEEDMILTKLRCGERVSHYETVRVRKDGTFVDVSLCVSPIRDRHGQCRSLHARPDRDPGAPSGRGERARRPQSGRAPLARPRRVPGHRLPRAPHAPERRAGLDPTAAPLPQRRRNTQAGAGRHRTRRPRPGSPDRRPSRHEPHHLGQAAAGDAIG